jgi:two-component system NtrC family sensor kinase
MKKKNNKAPKRLSIMTGSLYRQFTVAFALMAIIPILANGYFLVTYLLPNIIPQENIFMIISISLILSLLGFIILKKNAGSISNLKQHLETIASGDITQRCKIHNGTEVDSIGKSVNLILQKLQQNQKKLEQFSKQLEEKVEQRTQELKETRGILIQAEKLYAIGQLASGVAHEVRNPLGIIVQGVNYLEKKISSKEEGVSEILTMVKDGIKRADKIIGSLLDFSKDTSLKLRPQDINSILKESLDLIKTELKSKNIDIIKETKKNTPKVLIDKNKIEQVFVNIFLNAIQAIPKRGKIIIRSYDKQLEKIKNKIGRREEDHFKVGEKAVMVEIEDTGIGIPKENLKRIFDPFFTTKGPSGGAGLGLSVSRNIIAMHKALIDIESQKDKGTKLIITLKAAGKQ